MFGGVGAAFPDLFGGCGLPALVPLDQPDQDQGEDAADKSLVNLRPLFTRCFHLAVLRDVEKASGGGVLKCPKHYYHQSYEDAFGKDGYNALRQCVPWGNVYALLYPKLAAARQRQTRGRHQLTEESMVKWITQPLHEYIAGIPDVELREDRSYTRKDAGTGKICPQLRAEMHRLSLDLRPWVMQLLVNILNEQRMSVLEKDYEERMERKAKRRRKEANPQDSSPSVGVAQLPETPHPTPAA